MSTPPTSGEHVSLLCPCPFFVHLVSILSSVLRTHLVLLVHWASIRSDLLSEAEAASGLALFTHLLWKTQSLVRHQIHISTRTATGTEQTHPPQSWAYTRPSLILLPHSRPLLLSNPLAQDPILGGKLLRGDIWLGHYAHGHLYDRELLV